MRAAAFVRFSTRWNASVSARTYGRNDSRVKIAQSGSFRAVPALLFSADPAFPRAFPRRGRRSARCQVSSFSLAPTRFLHDPETSRVQDLSLFPSLYFSFSRSRLAVVKKDLKVPRELANFRVKEARIAIVLGTERARDYRFNGSDWIPRSSTPGWNFKDKRLRWSGVIRRLIYRRMLPVFSRVDCSFSVSSMEFYIGIQQSRGLGILNWGNLRKEKRKGTFALSKINARTFSLGNGISLFS